MSRIREFFQLGTAPGLGDDERTFLQHRMALFFGVLAVIAWLLYFMSLVMMQVYLPGNFIPWITRPVRVIHLIVALDRSFASVFVRGKTRSLATLQHVDIIGSLVLNVATTAMMFGIPAAYAGAAMLTAAAYIIHSSAPGAADPVLTMPVANNIRDSMPLRPSPSVVVVLCLVWGSVAVGISVITSRVIYGLHKRIEQVAQLGQYRLDEKIGEGGMGIVYRASHAMLRRPTAIKLLQPEKAGAGALGRFEREVQNTAKLTHPNTVAIYDYGRTPDGLFYYAMEYLDGIDLEELVAHDGAQPPARVIHVMKQVAPPVHVARSHHGARYRRRAQRYLCARRRGLFSSHGRTGLRLTQRGRGVHASLDRSGATAFASRESGHSQRPRSTRRRLSRETTEPQAVVGVELATSIVRHRRSRLDRRTSGPMVGARSRGHSPKSRSRVVVTGRAHHCIDLAERA